MSAIKPVANYNGEFSVIQDGDVVDTSVGGTGLSSFTAGSFLKALNSSTLQMRTPAQVLDDIGAASSTYSINAGNGLSGGGTLSTSRTITLGTPSDITLSSTNSVSSTSHTHAFSPGGTTSQYIRGDGSLATFPSIGSGTVTSVSAGNGLDFTTITTSGAITLGTPSTLSGSTTNAVTATSHTHALSANLSAWDALAPSAKQDALGFTPANSSTSISAGNGLTGGGTLAANRSITLGTPGTISGSSTNSVTTTSHTHALTLTSSDITGALGFTPYNATNPNGYTSNAGTVTSVAAGNGLNFTTITGSGSVALGTPSTITGSSTNSVTTNSHTHALTLTSGDITGALGFTPYNSTNPNGYTSNTGTVTSVTGGNGLTGSVSSSGSLALGTPSSITLSSTNAVTSTSHTHAFSPGGTTNQYIRGDGSLATFPSIGSGTVTSVSAGNGMTFTTITGSGAVTLGTPSTLSGSTTNAVTANSHTHALSANLSAWDALAPSAKADDSSVVHLDGDETITGAKTFTAIPTFDVGQLRIKNGGEPQAGIAFVDDSWGYLIWATTSGNPYLGIDGTPNDLTATVYNSGVYDWSWRVERTTAITSFNYTPTVRSGSNYYDVWHGGNFTPSDYALATRSISAGNGLTGGGNLTANRSIALGTPSTLTMSTGNSVTSTSHTHAINLSFDPPNFTDAVSTYPAGISTGNITDVAKAHITANEVGGNRVLQFYADASGGSNIPDVYIRSSHSSLGGGGWTSAYKLWHAGNLNPSNYMTTSWTISAGNGLTGGGSGAANRSLTLGTPGTLSGSTTNSVTTSSHTHALSANLSAWDDITPSSKMDLATTTLTTLDDADYNGFYRVNGDTNTADRPTGGWLWAIHHAYSGSYGFQLVWPNGLDDFYLRRQQGGTWHPYRKIWHDGNFTATNIPTQSASIGFTNSQGVGINFWNSSAYSIYMSSSTHATFGGRVAGDSTSDYNMYFKMTSGTNRGFVFMNGSSAVGGVDGTGNIRATGDITAYSSDGRLKLNKSLIKEALSKIRRIGGYEYDWDLAKTKELGFTPYQEHEHGLIAQEVEEVIPDAVRVAPFNEEYLTIKYERTIPLIIEGVKELDKKVRDLEDEVRYHKDRFDALESMIMELRNKIEMG